MKNKMDTSLLTDELMKKLYADIKEFRTTFMLPVENPAEFSEKSDSLHTSLFVEELIELADADNLIDIADSITDQVYVLVGRVVELGHWVPEVTYIVSCLLKVAEIKEIDFVKCWDEVHASNMSKLALNEEQLRENVKFYSSKGVELNPSKTEKGYVLKCAKDCIYKNSPVKEGKVMKSIFYKDADLSFVSA
ncbi:SAM-dependent methyltransferase [Vibrio chagasii]|nr:SAM-dependent methyltransferase [Vibrio chagasii]